MSVRDNQGGGATKKNASKNKTSFPDAAFEKLGLTQPDRALLYFPLRFENQTQLTPIDVVCDGQHVLIQGVIDGSEILTQGSRKQWVLSVSDKTGTIRLRFLHFYPKQVSMYEVGKLIRVYGVARSGFWGFEMVHPTCRFVTPQTPLENSLTPVYPTTQGVSQQRIVQAIKRGMIRLNHPTWQEYLSQTQLDKNQCEPLSDSIRYLHQPSPDMATEVGIQDYEERNSPQWRRVKLDELIAQQAALRVMKAERNKRMACPLPKVGLSMQLINGLPFKLTQAQQKSWQEISHDMQQSQPMQRLLQGDVGSGKTVIAALTALQAIDNGFQVAVMAPTELLAEQLFRKFSEWLMPMQIEPLWLAGSLTKRKKQQVQQALEEGAPIVVGTHALIQDGINFQRLGLVIIDEQHRFGVVQRIALFNQSETHVPHLLMMSATPIPRTLTMTYFADLDVSVMNERPPGRSDIDTRVISQSRKEEVIDGLRHALEEGRQAYWVCPLIEESEKLSLQDVLSTFELLQAQLTPFAVGLLHGRLSATEKNVVMESFRAGEIRLLVATTVIEVGVDVPNASLMIIENAERFGLAQLHQLRGRVGRGSVKSHCWLLYDQSTLSETGRARLAILRRSQDGFDIAQEDLRLRGPGELLGEQQAGQPMLRYANLYEDEDLIRAAQTLCEQLMKNDKERLTMIMSRWHQELKPYWAG
jgi:ATP-dependent DNA helicase RecG